MTISQRRAVAGNGAVLAAITGSLLLANAHRFIFELGVDEWPWGRLVIGSALMVLSVALASYLGSSIAGEEQRLVIDVRDGAAWQRQGRPITPVEVREVIAAGAGTPREIAEVLGVFEHAVVTVLASQSRQGRVTQIDGRYVLVAQPATPPAPARAARWIESTDGTSEV